MTSMVRAVLGANASRRVDVIAVCGVAGTLVHVAGDVTGYFLAGHRVGFVEHPNEGRSHVRAARRLVVRSAQFARGHTTFRIEQPIADGFLEAMAIDLGPVLPYCAVLAPCFASSPCGKERKR